MKRNKNHPYPKFNYNRAKVISKYKKAEAGWPGWYGSLRWHIFQERYTNIINPYNRLHAFTYICKGHYGTEFAALEAWYNKPKKWRKSLEGRLTQKLVNLIIKNGMLDMLIDMTNYEIDMFGKIDPATYDKAQQLETMLRMYRKNHGTL